MAGSRTQCPRQITRFGSNQVPMCGQGRVRKANDNGYQPGMRFRPILKLPRFTGSFTISGVTRDGSGSTLGSCRVNLFKTDAQETWLAETVSDGSGVFSFNLAQNSGTFWIQAYKGGAPDVAGMTKSDVVANGTVDIYLRDPTSASSGGNTYSRARVVNS